MSVDNRMYELKIFNPVLMQLETVLSLPALSQIEAKTRAEEFLVRHGVKFGELFESGEPKGIVVSGYEDEDSAASSRGGFGFLPSSPIYHVFKHIREVLDVEIRSFVDLGCGPGNILLAASTLLGASRLTGVELDGDLVERARQNTRSINATIIEADLLKWVPGTNDFDMVYAYEPIRDRALRLEFFAHLKDWLNPGQYVFYQRAVGDVPGWLKQVDLTSYKHPCVFRVEK